MRPQICPDATSNETLSSATMPPKRTDSPLIARSGRTRPDAASTLIHDPSGKCRDGTPFGAGILILPPNLTSLRPFFALSVLSLERPAGFCAVPGRPTPNWFRRERKYLQKAHGQSLLRKTFRERPESRGPEDRYAADPRLVPQARRGPGMMALRSEEGAPWVFPSPSRWILSKASTSMPIRHSSWRSRRSGEAIGFTTICPAISRSGMGG